MSATDVTPPTQTLTAPVLTRNQQSGPTNFKDDHLDIVISYGPKGSETGEDYQDVPPEVLQRPAFIRAVRNGVITIEDDSPEVREAFERQSRVFSDRRQRDRDLVDRSMDDAPNEDYVTQPCVGPSAKGKACGADVPVKQAHKDRTPPLCAQHKPLEASYVLTETGDLDSDGKPVVTWVRSSISREAFPSQADDSGV